VAVARVLAQAKIGDHDQVGVRLLDRSGRELDDALVVPGAGALLVLARRKPEQEDGRDPQRCRLPGLVDGVRDGKPVDARHRLDRFAPVDPVSHEHRVDEIGGIQARLAHEAAQGTGRAQPAQTGLREGHGYAQHTRG
jgi:hypothetical protein